MDALNLLGKPIPIFASLQIPNTLCLSSSFSIVLENSPQDGYIPGKGTLIISPVQPQISFDKDMAGHTAGNELCNTVDLP